MFPRRLRLSTYDLIFIKMKHEEKISQTGCSIIIQLYYGRTRVCFNEDERLNSTTTNLKNLRRTLHRRSGLRNASYILHVPEIYNLVWRSTLILTSILPQVKALTWFSVWFAFSNSFSLVFLRFVNLESCSYNLERTANHYCRSATDTHRNLYGRRQTKWRNNNDSTYT